jgi:hypothetical protein
MKQFACIRDHLIMHLHAVMPSIFAQPSQCLPPQPARSFINHNAGISLKLFENHSLTRDSTRYMDFKNKQQKSTQNLQIGSILQCLKPLQID